MPGCLVPAEATQGLPYSDSEPNRTMKKQTPLTQVLLASLLLAPTSALLLSPLAASAAETKPAAKPAPAIELGAPFADNAILPPLHPRLRPPHEPTPRISKFLPVLTPSLLPAKKPASGTGPRIVIDFLTSPHYI